MATRKTGPEKSPDQPDPHNQFLEDILASLNCAVVAIGLDGEIYLTNRAAGRLGLVGNGLIQKWLEEAKARASSRVKAVHKIKWDGPDGRKLSISVSPLKSKDEKRGGFVFIIDDVTEIARLRKQSMRADRLMALGEMAAGMAHEVRNPLGGIEIFTSLLMRELKGDDEKTKMLAHIATGVQSINNVISNFLLFTKEPKPNLREFDCKKLILDTLEFAGYVFEQNKIVVKSFLPDGEIPMTGDPDLVRQVLLNMIHNSTQAMPDGGLFTLSARTVLEEGAPVSVEIICKDTGPGIDSEVRDKVFDPFFTTKDSGAGLGLAIVSQIVQAHGGYVDILESPEAGAAFVISLPLEG
ncbi:hypothetical protein MNBD_NITROSPINAE02-777 [hydrothermal vent metagenome]|uniref:Histidine kinase domain-containing protein n=1 Tax=hydrothermal vent metagenome TaxID=652676 RepID=A0A3B1BQK2_9ZZZZ